MNPIYQISLKTLDGQPASLSKYAGKTLLIVNTASECGFTPQYEGLEALNKKYASQGLVVLGFPSNDFGEQEPGTSEQIARFCQRNFGVAFPLFEKAPVSGPQKQPLYAHLTQNAPAKGEVAWNFEKFLVNKKGDVVGRFKSKVEPMSAELVSAIEKELNSA